MSLKDKTSNWIWVEKYRPQTLDEYICSSNFRNTIREWIQGNNKSHLILESAQPGTGKTTLATIIANETVGKDNTLYINASLESGIDSIRDKVLTFCSFMGFGGKNKVVIFDESDQFSHKANDALKGILEEYFDSVRFIFTCNDITKMSEPLQDRCEIINFSNLHANKEDRKEVGNALVNLCCRIMEENDIKYDKETIVHIIRLNFKSCLRFRTIIRTLYKYSRGGELQSQCIKDLSTNDLIQTIKSKKGSIIVEYAQNYHHNWRQLFDDLYENSDEYFNTKNPDSFFEALFIIEEYSRLMIVAPIPALTFQMCLLRLSNLPGLINE